METKVLWGSDYHTVPLESGRRHCHMPSKDHCLAELSQRSIRWPDTLSSNPAWPPWAFRRIKKIMPSKDLHLLSRAIFRKWKKKIQAAEKGKKRGSLVCFELRQTANKAQFQQDFRKQEGKLPSPSLSSSPPSPCPENILCSTQGGDIWAWSVLCLPCLYLCSRGCNF